MKNTQKTMSSNLLRLVRKVRFMFLSAALCCCAAAIADGQSSPQKLEQLQAELQLMVNGSKRVPYEDLKKSGWKFPEFGSSTQPWPHRYLVLQKAGVYGVIVTQGKKNGNVDDYGFPYYNYRGGANSAYVLADIPAGYLPVVGCNKIADWKDAERRCKASKGEDCSLNTPRIEMVVFVKMPSKCAQESTLLHSAYRYVDEKPTRLQSVPTEGMTCLVEEHRAKQCPVLMQ